ncbi:Glycerophosphoryl diester phosphodiesterase family-domain-containing protein [Scheffersomyces coipomensis]|uniref:Glycerophosphoryl diester phosphodiesterase family-domain-containing protein n=1 Tax=Scheffersomyces coipomensis TaxID=1788519 RepID=UPI00315C9AEC
MKFGKTFVSHQIPEWSIFYMQYKQLKKIIKNVDQVFDDFQQNQSESTQSISDIISHVLSSFFFELDRDIERVNEFYNVKYNEYKRRLDKIIQVLGYNNQSKTINHQIESNDELDEILHILLELKTIFRNLKWFGELNHKGFIKILKKLDKKISSLIHDNLDSSSETKFSFELSNQNKDNYLSTRVNALPFANETELISSLDTINILLNQLDDGKQDEEEISEAEIIRNESRNFKFLNIGTRRRHSFDQSSLDNYYDLILTDNSSLLITELSKVTDRISLKFLISLLNKSATDNSTHCIDELFIYLEKFVINKSQIYENFLYDPSDISGRNFFHQHIISLGKKQFIKEQTAKEGEIPEEESDDEKISNNFEGLSYILHKIEHSDPKLNLKQVLIAKDNYSRTPLHYSAQYGLKVITNIFLDYLSNWDLINTNVSIDNIEVWGDQENLTPLHLSIIGKHPKTTENLIIFNNANKLTCQDLLLLSVRLNSPRILNSLLIQGKIDINYTDLEHNNESALYIASKLNYVNLVEFLLKNKADPEIGELVFGWTPIFIAASEGYKEVVELLLDYDTNFEIVDGSGWLPMEHACLRGHLAIADLLKPKNEKVLIYDVYHPENNLPREFSASASAAIAAASEASLPPSITPTQSISLEATSSIDKLPEPTSKHITMNDVYKQLKQTGSSSSIPRSKSPLGKRRKAAKPIKSFGHRFLQPDESLILITLGTTDLRDNETPIDLNKISTALTKSFKTELDTALSLSISCKQKLSNKLVEPPVIIDLPLEDHHGSATDPITFKLNNNVKSNDIIITFDLIPTYQLTSELAKPQQSNDKVLGRAMAILKDAYTKVGSNYRSLNNNITVPILESSTLDILGSIRFEYLCVTPFEHKSMSIERSDTYWKQLVSTRVIGHRGLGKNENGKKSLQLGENTVESFIAAASLGASYVEFDVQLTKDSVPVVYHDFLVAESGVDIPMHSLTAEQFLGLSEEDGNKQHIEKKTQDDEALKYRPRAKSSHELNKIGDFKLTSSSTIDKEDKLSEKDEDPHHYQNTRRMKLTRTWKDKGFKGNARGLSVASSFVTLKELFKKVPKNVGFNMELKYPMLDEAQEENMGEIAMDLNYYVDTILKTVYDENTSGRDILFSSFHPDVCALLSLKQPTMPILFLTESGTSPMADIRASSLQNAVRFAKKWNLLGIVSAAGAIVKTPRLAQVVKSSGLVCVTYGGDNNDPELAKIQMKAGVDAVIVDNVLAVREGLRKDHAMKVLDDED